jgi:3-oxoacyl-[acyl-carrier protein] reductase
VLNLDLHGRVAIVTGASRRRGIGAAICRALAEQGADIFFTHWGRYDVAMDLAEDGDGPDGLRATLLALGVRCADLEVDLADIATPVRILDAATAQLGAPTILVNNATHSTTDGYEALDAATLDAHYAVNMRGTMLLSAEFARRYPGGAGGRIINLTSGQNLGPMPTELAYGATKAAIVAFTLSLSAAIAARGITVNAVNPGPTDTGWMTDDLKQALLTKFPGRLGQPEDAARLITFLASDAAAWITGQTINSEGSFIRS